MRKYFISLVALCFLLNSFVDVADAQSADISLNIRDGSNIVFSGLVSLPTSGNVDISDSNGNTHSVNAQSVLSMLSTADLADDTWSVSDLTFYDSFGSFYVKCIDYGGGEKCDNWQYVVDGTSPFSSIDQSILSGGEEVYLYFGNPHQVVSSSSSVEVNQSFQVTAQNYDYENDVWEPLTGVTIGITQPNPSDAFNPTEVLTQAVDGSGVATFSVATTGSYNVGIKEDYYFPTIPLTVNAVSSGGGSGGGGGGSSSGSSSSSQSSGSISELPDFDLSDAVQFLQEQVSEDGSFGSSTLYADWVAVAYGGAKVKGEPKEALIKYLATQKPSELLTDNERRVLALLSLGQNPYSFGGVNYIDLILKDFDNKQFGEPNLVNDDIFAVISLFGAGYTVEDEIIKKDIEFILSEQKTNGSWEGSVDLTASAVQALYPFKDIEEVASAIELSRKYLKTSQKEDGGWGSVYTTSWVLQVEDLLDQEWTQNKKSGENYLALYQQGDGGVLAKKDKKDNRIWATSYAIPGVVGKSWLDIIEKVPKQTSTLIKADRSIDNEVATVVATAPNVNSAKVVRIAEASSSKKTEPVVPVENLKVELEADTSSINGEDLVASPSSSRVNTDMVTGMFLGAAIVLALVGGARFVIFVKS